MTRGARLSARLTALAAFALSLCQTVFGGDRVEIHAVWDHSGTGLYPGNWPRTVQVLKNAHVTDLFVNVAGIDFAHYGSAFLPRSWTCKSQGDQLRNCLTAAKATGLRVHAWVICFNAIRNDPKTMAAFRAQGWLMRDEKGAMTTYVNPSVPAVRSRVLAIVDEIQARAPVAGIHLDFVRWGESVPKPPQASAVITKFVAEARRHVIRPRWLTVAVYGKHPKCVSTVGQDWMRWLDLGLVDYVVPMDYTTSNVKFAELLSLQSSPAWKARRTIVGIGVTSTGANLGAAQVAQQIRLARRYGFAGQSLFDLDRTLERNILPRLGGSVW